MQGQSHDIFVSKSIAKPVGKLGDTGFSFSLRRSSVACDGGSFSLAVAVNVIASIPNVAVILSSFSENKRAR